MRRAVLSLQRGVFKISAAIEGVPANRKAKHASWSDAGFAFFNFLRNPFEERERWTNERENDWNIQQLWAK